MLRFSVLAQLLFCALTLELCAALKPHYPPDRPPSIMRVAAIIADYSGLIACVVFQQAPTRLFDTLLFTHGAYERRNDRKNAAIRFATLFC